MVGGRVEVCVSPAEKSAQEHAESCSSSAEGHAEHTLPQPCNNTTPPPLPAETRRIIAWNMSMNYKDAQVTLLWERILQDSSTRKNISIRSDLPLPTLPKMYTPLGGRGGLGGAPTASANWACCARALATATPAAPWSEAGWVASCALSQPTRVCALLGAFLLWAASSCRRAFACLRASCKQPQMCR